MASEYDSPGPHLPFAVDMPGPDMRDVAGSVARSILVVTILVGIYYAAPMDSATTGAILVRVAIGAVVIALVVAAQIRSVSRSSRPQLRAIEGLAVAVTLMVVAFATAYVSISTRDAVSFSEPLGRTAALYFTLTTLTTVGFGDIAARTDAARIAVMLQMVFNVAVIGVAVRLILGTARARVRAGRGPSGSTAGAAGRPGVTPGGPAQRERDE